MSCVRFLLSFSVLDLTPSGILGLQEAGEFRWVDRDWASLPLVPCALRTPTHTFPHLPSFPSSGGWGWPLGPYWGSREGCGGGAPPAPFLTPLGGGARGRGTLQEPTVESRGLRRGGARSGPGLASPVVPSNPRPAPRDAAAPDCLAQLWSRRGASRRPDPLPPPLPAGPEAPGAPRAVDVAGRDGRGWRTPVASH